MSRVPLDAAAGALVDRLDDDLAMVRNAAARALVALAAQMGPDRLVSVLLSGSQAAAVAALGALGPAAVPDTDAAIQTCLKRSEAQVRVAAIAACSERGFALDAVAEALANDRAPDVRRAAAMALATRPDSIDALVAALGDEAVRETAMGALKSLGWEPNSTTGQAIMALAERDFAALVSLGEASLPLLSRATSETDPSKEAVAFRAKLIDCLGEIAGSAAAAVPLAERSLDDVGGVARAAGARAVGRCGKAASAPARARLLEILTSDPWPAARMAAAVALGLMVHKPALGDLRDRAERDDDEKVRFAAAEAVASMGDALLLIEELRSDNGATRLAAASALGPLGSKDAIDPLINALSDSLATVRGAALAALAELGWTPVGVKRAPDDPRYTRWMTRSEQLERAGLNDAEQSELLARDLAAAEPLIRQAALEALSMRQDARLATMALPLLNDEVPQVRHAAAMTLDALGATPEAGEEAAAWRVAMGQIGEAAKLGSVALPVLLRTITSPLANERAEAAHGLATVGGTGSKEALAKALTDAEAYVRVNACLGITVLAPDDLSKLLTPLVADPHATVRTAASRSLTTAGPAGIGALVIALDHTEAGARHAAASALTLIGTAKAGELKKAAKILAKRVLGDDDPPVRVAAALALGAIGGRHPELRDALRNDTSYRVRSAAARALGQTGWSEAADDLVSALGDSYQAVRSAALKALGDVGWTPTSGVGDAMVRLADQDWRGLIAVGGPSIGLLAQVVIELGADPISVERRVRALETLLAIAEAAKDPVTIQQAADAIAPALGDAGGPARTIASQACGRLDLVMHADRLLEIAQDDPFERARVSAAAALARCGNTDQSEALLELADQADSPGVRLAARKALAGPAIGNLTPLLLALRSTHDAVRAEAADQLGDIGDVAAIDPLIERLGDAVPLVRAACRNALEKLGWVPIGIKGSGAETGFKRWLTLAEVSALAGGTIDGSVDQASLLVTALSNPKPDVRRAAIETLAMRGDPVHAKAIMACLEDPIVDVRKEAADGLLQLKKVPTSGAPAASWHVARGDMDAAAKLGAAAVPSLVRCYAEQGVVERTAVVKALTAFAGEKDSGAVVDLAVSALQDPEADVRRVAVGSIAALSESTASDVLKVRLSDSDPGVRRATQSALAGMGKAGVTTLLAALDGNAASRIAAVRGLAETTPTPAIVTSIGSLISGDPAATVRTAAIESLTALDPKGATDVFSERLKSDTSPMVRAAAAHGLGHSASKSAVGPLMAALGDGYGRVRDAALAAMDQLGHAPSDGVGKAALALANQDFKALTAVGEAGVPLIAQALAEQASDPDSQRKRASAVRCLSEIGGKAAGVAVVAALSDPASRVRASAVDAVGRLKLIRVAESLVELLQSDPDVTVRARSAFALGTLGATAQAKDLASAASLDDDPAVRSAAALALAGPGIGDVERLISQLGDGDPEVRRTAAAALGPVKNPKAIDPLISALADSFGGVRAAATASLAHLDWIPFGVRRTATSRGYDRWVLRQELNPSALTDAQLTVLNGALKQSEPMMRFAIAEAFGLLGDPNGRTSLEVLAGDSDTTVAARATQSLSSLTGQSDA